LAHRQRRKRGCGVELGGPFDRGKGGPGGWILLDEPELHLHGDVLAPDMAGWRRERMPELPDAPAFELAPDWICEVVSPSTATIDRAEKMPIYGSWPAFGQSELCARRVHAVRASSQSTRSTGTRSEGREKPGCTHIPLLPQ
jgi:hypothetical protein